MNGEDSFVENEEAQPGQDQRVQFFIEQVSEKYMSKMKEERAQSDQKQLRDMTLLLKDWADKITTTTKDIVGTIHNANDNGIEAVALDGIVDDIKDRQTKMIMVH